MGNSGGGQDGFVYTAPVGRYDPNAWGLFDMHGNVCEWCYGYAPAYYKGSPVDDPPGSFGAPCPVLRGGGWRWAPRNARSARRLGAAPADRNVGVGFRLARAQSVR